MKNKVFKYPQGLILKWNESRYCCNKLKWRKLEAFTCCLLSQKDDNWKLWKKWKVNGKLSTFDIYHIQRGEKERRPLHGDSNIGKFPFYFFNSTSFNFNVNNLRERWNDDLKNFSLPDNKDDELFSIPFFRIFPLAAQGRWGVLTTWAAARTKVFFIFSTVFEQISTSTKANTSDLREKCDFFRSQRRSFPWEMICFLRGTRTNNFLTPFWNFLPLTLKEVTWDRAMKTGGHFLCGRRRKVTTKHSRKRERIFIFAA